MTSRESVPILSTCSMETYAWSCVEVRNWLKSVGCENLIDRYNCHLGQHTRFWRFCIHRICTNKCPCLHNIQRGKRSYFNLLRVFIYIIKLCMQESKAQASLGIYASLLNDGNLCAEQFVLGSTNILMLYVPVSNFSVIWDFIFLV